MAPLQPIFAALPTLAVSMVYCFYRAYALIQKQRQKRLRERVAWMLWVMAEQVEECEPSV